MFFSIIEFGCHKLPNVDGLTFVTPNLSEWEGVPKAQGPHAHMDHLGPLTIGSTNPRCHSGFPFVPMVFGDFSWRGAQHVVFGEDLDLVFDY